MAHATTSTVPGWCIKADCMMCTMECKKCGLLLQIVLHLHAQVATDMDVAKARKARPQSTSM